MAAPRSVSNVQAAADQGTSSEAIFERERPRLMGIAYRMLGMRSEAEDVLQDAFLRWFEVDLVRIHQPEAFLTTVVTRLALDRLRRAARERLDYPGPWLPEPVGVDVTDEGFAPAPDVHYERAQVLSIATLRMLERCTPNERAAFVLRTALECSFAEIAVLLAASEPTSRQWYHRAQKRLAGASRFCVSEARRLEVGAQLLECLQRADVAATAALLSEDVEMHTDGGGKVQALIKPVAGADRIAQILVHLWHKAGSGLLSVPTQLNGGSTLVLADGGAPYAVVAMEVVEAPKLQIVAIDVVRNPDKLQQLTRPVALR